MTVVLIVIVTVRACKGPGSMLPRSQRRDESGKRRCEDCLAARPNKTPRQPAFGTTKFVTKNGNP